MTNEELKDNYTMYYISWFCEPMSGIRDYLEEVDNLMLLGGQVVEVLGREEADKFFEEVRLQAEIEREKLNEDR